VEVSHHRFYRFIVKVATVVSQSVAVLLGYSTTSKRYIVCNLPSSTLEEVHDVEFDEIKGSQEEDENLDDV
jgi:hypothetical protein